MAEEGRKRSLEGTGLYSRVRAEKQKILLSQDERLRPFLDERGRRLWAANETIGFGKDGILAVAEALGMSPVTIIAGAKELRRSGSGAGCSSDDDRLEREKRMKISVLAVVKAKEGMEEAVKQEVLSLIEPTRSEPGCISYDAHQGITDKSLFMFYETWRSKEDLEKHGEMPHLRAYKQRMKDLVEKPTEITLFEMIS